MKPSALADSAREAGLSPVTTDVISFTAERLNKLRGWQCRELPSVKIGEGKYGTVYRSPSGGGVLKESVTVGTHLGKCRQALREHAISLLQTLLVLEGCSPHLTLHYGADLSTAGPHFLGRMFMEEFAGSLADLGQQVLLTPAHWQVLLFQVLSPMLALGTVFGIAHNDLYPRNILVRLQSTEGPISYRIGLQTYVMDWPFFVAVTDFGIASARDLFGAEGAAPEVARGIEDEAVSPNFGFLPPRLHILRYKALPIFSRDVYTVLKWTLFQSKPLPRAPDAVRRWASAGLSLLDALRHTLDRSAGLSHVCQCFFSNAWAQASELPLRLEASPAAAEATPNFLLPPLPGKRESMLRTATAALGALPFAPAFMPADDGPPAMDKHHDRGATESAAAGGGVRGQPHMDL